MSRSIIFAVVSLPLAIVVTSIVPWGVAQERKPRSVIGDRLSNLLDSQPKESNDGDSEVTKLMKARYNASLNELNARHDGLLRGSFTLDQLFDSGRRLLDAELELTETAAERAVVLERAIGVIEEFEQKLQMRIEANVGSPAELYRLRYGRLGLAIDLLKVQGE